MNNGTKVIPRRSQSRRSPQQIVGVPLPGEPPEPLPELPLRLSEVSDVRLMDLFTLYVVWNNYADVQRVSAEIEEANLETELKVVEATSLSGWGPTDKVTFARAEMKSDPEYVALQRKYEQAKARRRLLAVLGNNMERAAALLSRELTRRVGRAPVEGRHAGWGT
jgi:hypothetical protein